MLSMRQAWKALCALCVGFFMVLIDQTTVAVALVSVMDHFVVEYDAVVWVPSIYLLCFVVPLLFAGRLGDRYGQGRVFRIGVAVFIVSAISAAFAPNMMLLLLARAVQGIGAAILTPQSMAVINRVFPSGTRGPAYGVWGTVGSVATLVGPVVGGFIVEAFGWRAVFLLQLPMGIVALVLAWLWIPRLPTASRSIDGLSVTVSLVSMSAIVVAIQQGPGLGWPVWVVLLAVGGIALFAWFIYLQSTAVARGTEALVPLTLFTDRNFTVGNISMTAMGFVIASQMIPIMMWLRNVRELDPSQAGLMMIPMAAVASVGSPLVGRVVDRASARLLNVAGFGIYGLGFIFVYFTMVLELPLVWFLLASMLWGVGNSLVWAANSVISMRDIDVTQMGAASGTYNTTRQVGCVIGAAAVGGLMQIGVATWGTTQGLATTILLLAAMMFVGAVASLFFTEASSALSTHC
ncbi:MAG: MFS transporter [Corynebacterium sp.]|nr:MFS transporter [Corynebacterium sp.]